MTQAPRIPHVQFRTRIAASAAFLLASACGTVALPVAPAAGTAAGAHTTASGTVLYVVVFKDDVNARSKAARAGVKPTFVYSKALSGFSANLTTWQRDRFAADPQTLMVTPANRDQMVPSAKRGTTPIEMTSQVAPRGIQRIGTLASPTAQIDGVDQRVPVDVAVLDGGVDVKQPDLNVRNGANCAAGDWSVDGDGHGTMVAGVVAALDNAFGVVGVAPGARIWPVKVFTDAGVSNDANLLCGLDWVMSRSNTLEIANLSLSDIGTDDGHCGLVNHDPVHLAICHVVNRGGVTVVVSAGNESTDAAQVVPASYSEVITVSSMADSDGQPGGLGGPTCEGDPDDSFSFYSNLGAAIDLAAPGDCVGTTFPNGLLALDSGTSFSAPHVAGAAALYLAGHPWASPTQVRAALIAHRERTALPGDPDGINEGIVNVAGW